MAEHEPESRVLLVVGHNSTRCVFVSWLVFAIPYERYNQFIQYVALQKVVGWNSVASWILIR